MTTPRMRIPFRIAIAGILVVAIVLIAGGYFFFVRGGSLVGAQAPEIAGETPKVDPRPPGVPLDWQRFENEQYGFSIYIPPGLSVVPFDEGGGARTFSFENKETEEGFQIFVVPYFEETISQERFLEDAPSGVMNEATDLTVDGVKASKFFSEHMMIGETREVWFLKDKYLYEVTTPKHLDAWLMIIMDSWRFTR